MTTAERPRRLQQDESAAAVVASSQVVLRLVTQGEQVSRPRAAADSDEVSVTWLPGQGTPLRRPVHTQIDADINDVRFPGTLLSFYSATLPAQAFRDTRFIFVLHFLYDLLFLFRAFQRSGLNPAKALVLYKPYPYANRDVVSSTLKAWGYACAPVEARAEVVSRFMAASDERVIIVEDGGYNVTIFHAELGEHRGRVIGAVEQTTKGIRRDAAVGQLAFPVLSVAQSRIKTDFEPSPIAHAVWRNITHLVPNIHFPGHRAVVIGYGTIGRALAHLLRQEGMLVRLVDQSVYKLALARHEGFEGFKETRHALPGARLVIGATGERTIGPDELVVLPDGVLLASASSDQEEIGVAAIQQLAHRVSGSLECSEYVLDSTGRRFFLLAEGYPVNFYGTESVPNELFDLILTQLYLSAHELAARGNVLSPEISSKVVDELCDHHRLVEKFYELHFK